VPLASSIDATGIVALHSLVEEPSKRGIGLVVIGLPTRINS
jgi:hypothetical protein